VRFLVLTSIAVTAATAAALAQPDQQQCQLADRADDRAGPAADQDSDRRPGGAPLVATPAVPVVVEPVMVAVPVDIIAPHPAELTAAVIAFAPKTSPPRVRWS
jgi:hypothetical protein